VGLLRSRVTLLKRFFKRRSEEKGPWIPEMLKGKEAYARCFLRVAYGRRRPPVEKQQARGQDVEVALKYKRGLLRPVAIFDRSNPEAENPRVRVKPKDTRGGSKPTTS
jgi:hypothetical protein